VLQLHSDEKPLWDGISEVCSWVLGILGGRSLVDLALRVRKKVLYCGLQSSNAHYWKVSDRLKIILSGVGLFVMFGATGFGYKRTGSVSELGHTSVTVLALALQYWCSQIETVIWCKYMHVNSVAVNRCFGIAHLMATLEAWVANILKHKSVEKLWHMLNGSSGLG